MGVCNFCGNKNLKETKAEYIYKHDGKLMVVENVPAIVCEFCGERYFKAEVLKKIERDFFEIYSDGKKPLNILSVPVEEYDITRS